MPSGFLCRDFLRPGFFLTVLLIPLAAQSQDRAPARPPVAAVKPVTDDYFGTKITDPYRWMEAGASDPEFLAYLKAQNDYTRSTLAPLAGQRNKLLARLEELDNAVPLVSSPTRGGARRRLRSTCAPPSRRTAANSSSRWCGSPPS